jgi:hypothetical protein
MLASGMAFVSRVPTPVPVADLDRRTRANVDRHGVVVLLGGRSQARQLRRLQAALRAGGYQARYFTDGAALHQLVVTAPGQEMPRAIGSWGG